MTYVPRIYGSHYIFVGQSGLSGALSSQGVVRIKWGNTCRVFRGYLACSERSRNLWGCHSYHYLHRLTIENGNYVKRGKSESGDFWTVVWGDLLSKRLYIIWGFCSVREHTASVPVCVYNGRLLIQFMVNEPCYQKEWLFSAPCFLEPPGASLFTRLLWLLCWSEEFIFSWDPFVIAFMKGSPYA